MGNTTPKSHCVGGYHYISGILCLLLILQVMTLRVDSRGLQRSHNIPAAVGVIATVH